MSSPNAFPVHRGWRILLRDLGINPSNVLRRAQLPADLFARESAGLKTDEYFRLWRGLEEEADDPILPIRIGRAISVEAFDPPIFAALCSPDLNTALARIAQYKRLSCPMALEVAQDAEGTLLNLRWLESATAPPPSLSATESVFFVQLARLATRSDVKPLRLTLPDPPGPVADYETYFGTAVQRAPKHSIRFSAQDARRPFLTANEPMWRFFEPKLQQRLSELDDTATLSDRVRGALLELLPAGAVSMEAVSRKLGVGSRTLQRRLNAEGNNFQSMVNRTREELARHYLRHSKLSGAEIAFLLGYEDPNSFVRAFHTWTGVTPEFERSRLQAG